MSETPRYRLESKPHGAGGYARIVKGFDEVLERQVAVKILDPLAQLFPEKDQERFRKEARILAKMSHPNIPAIFDVDFSDEGFRIYFEFIDGISLAEHIDQIGPITFKNAVPWFIQISAALSHAHSLGIVHRDIKPSNIMVTHDNRTAYLIDFGIAVSAEDTRKITETGFTIGTRGYMSPEQEAGEDLDEATDIYSLGVTLYEVLAGIPISVGNYQELSSKNEAIPPEIDELIRECINPRERRVGTAIEFITRLVSSTQVKKPLSVVLGKGRLHEIANAIAEYTPEEFVELPQGQRVLILNRMESVIKSEDDNLTHPGADLLELLLEKAMLFPSDDYRRIVRPAIRWAYEQEYPTYKEPGKRSLQVQIEDVCLSITTNHKVLREELESFLDSINWEEKPTWYFHSMRKVLQALLANPRFVSDAEKIGAHLQKIDEMS